MTNGRTIQGEWLTDGSSAAAPVRTRARGRRSRVHHAARQRIPPSRPAPLNARGRPYCPGSDGGSLTATGSRTCDRRHLEGACRSPRAHEVQRLEGAAPGPGSAARPAMPPAAAPGGSCPAPAGRHGLPGSHGPRTGCRKEVNEVLGRTTGARPGNPGCTSPASAVGAARGPERASHVAEASSASVHQPRARRPTTEVGDANRWRTDRTHQRRLHRCDRFIRLEQHPIGGDRRPGKSCSTPMR
jgi:hypothetical protein